jgi:sec-independent protein translocase protein TatA
VLSRAGEGFEKSVDTYYCEKKKTNFHDELSAGHFLRKNPCYCFVHISSIHKFLDVVNTCFSLWRPFIIEKGKEVDMFGIGAQELLVILVILVLLFGSKKLPELARGVGESIKEVRKGMSDDPKEKEHHHKSE